MAISISLTNVATLQNQSIVSAINANNVAITAAFQDALSRSGTLPNTMSSNLDMNSNQILNLPPPSSINSPIRVQDYVVAGGLSASAFVLLAGNPNTLTGINNFTNTTQATSVSTGAVVISGGLGIAKNLWVGGSLNITGSFNVATLAGGTLAASTLTLESTSNVAPSGDSISIQGSKIFFKSATGGSTFGDYNNTTSNTWTFTGNVNVVGNFGVTGSSSTFSFSGANLGLGTNSPITNAGYSTLTMNGTTGGEIIFTTANVQGSQIFNDSSARMWFNLINNTKFIFANNGTPLFDYNNTNANSWTFSTNVFINGNLIDTSGNTTLSTLTVTGAASNIKVSGSNIFGGTGASSTLILTSTGSGAPSGDSVVIRGTSVTYQTLGLTTFGSYNSAIANTWTFSGTGGVTINTAVGNMLTVTSANSGSTNSLLVANSGTGTLSATAAQLGAQINGVGFITLNLFGGSGASGLFGQILSSSGMTNGFKFITQAGPMIFNPLTTLQFISNATAVGDFGLTNVNAWTFRGSSGVIIDTAVGTMLNVSSANTGSVNSIQVNNSGTIGTATTSATFTANLSGGSSAFFSLSAVGGATSQSQLLGGAGLTNGMNIQTNAGLIVINPKTTLNIQSNSVAVGDFGATTANTWTFAGTAGVVINTATGTMLNITSANTSAGNTAIINNSGTSTLAATTAIFRASVGGGTINVTMTAVGGSGGTGLVGQLASGVGMTNGLQLISNAGNVTIIPTGYFAIGSGYAIIGPSTQAGTSFTADTAHYTYITTSASAVTVTLPSASSNPGFILNFKQVGAGAVSSAASNVSPIGSATPGTAITTASGKYATLQSDGTNWIVIAAN